MFHQDSFIFQSENKFSSPKIFSSETFLASSQIVPRSCFSWIISINQLYHVNYCMHTHQTRDIIDESCWHALRTDLLGFLAASNECKNWSVLTPDWQHELCSWSFLGGEKSFQEFREMVKFHHHCCNSFWKTPRGNGPKSTEFKILWFKWFWKKPSSGADPGCSKIKARTPCQGFPCLPLPLWCCRIISVLVFGCSASALLKWSLCCVQCRFISKNS